MAATPSPSTASSAAALATTLRAEAVKHQKALRTAAACVGALVAIKMAWSYAAARAEARRDAEEDAFRPMSASERFDSDMRRVEAKHKALSTAVNDLAIDRASLWNQMGAEDPEEFRAVWRKQSCKAYILNDELITKLLIEVDGIGIPQELVVEAIEDAQHQILPPVLDARQRRKNLIRQLHELSTELNGLQY